MVQTDKKQRLTTSTFNILDASVVRGHFLGDYMGLTAIGKTVFPVFGIATATNLTADFVREITRHGQFNLQIGLMNALLRTSNLPVDEPAVSTTSPLWYFMVGRPASLSSKAAASGTGSCSVTPLSACGLDLH